MVFAACTDDDKDTPSGGSEGGQGATAGTTPDPCSLVTVDEVSAALGSPLNPPEPSAMPPPIGGKGCLFTNSDGPPVKMFQIVVRTDADFDQQLRDLGNGVERLFEDTRNLANQGGTVTEAVGGLGGVAYKAPSGYYVLKNGVLMQTNIGLDADPSLQARSALQSLTERAYSRL